MKRLIVFTFSLFGMGTVLTAQDKKGFTQFSLRGGLNFAHQYNLPKVVKTPLLGYGASFSADRYFSFWGLGFDVDFSRNRSPRYDSTGMTETALPFATKQYTDSASRLESYFAGIGPSFVYGKGKFSAELALRGGASRINGGLLRADALFVDPIAGPLSMSMYDHPGWDEKLFAAGKVRLQANYAITKRLLASAAISYIYHFNSETPYSYSEIIALPTNVNYVTDISSISSYSAYAGLSYRIYGRDRSKTKPQPAPVPIPELPDTTPAKDITRNIRVLVKDEQTGQPLYKAEVLITGENGKGARGTTDKNGILIFPETVKNHYVVSASLNDISATKVSISPEAFDSAGSAINIVLTHNDPRFTLVGKAINKTSGEPEGEVQVTLTNETKSSVKQGSSAHGSGEFRFQLDPGSDFNVVGRKKSYISNIERVTTKGLNRSQALYVELELGVEEATPGKRIVLENIYYDLNKVAFRDEASSDLRKLIVFLHDNPDLRVEISSHTDSRGSDAYNMQLSQKRANYLADYLVKNGIDRSRLIARGYGETAPVNGCTNGVRCNEQEHAKNRRTELKVME